tara:strand:+ start:298 stop:939 length:642 start_codon:yes stop_codon:yes gene_type:complete
MKNKKIVAIWDENKILKENIKFLQTKTKTVTFPASDFIKNIVQDLIDAYKVINCAGIAANQIGYEYQIFIGMKELINIEDAKDIEKAEANLTEIDENPHADNYEIYINPQIDKIDRNSINQDEEGCLSIPGLLVDRERYDIIKVRYYNINGKVKKTTMTGFLSKLFQHELDHLNGILMIDDISKLNNLYPIDETEKNVEKYQTLYSAYNKLKK